MESSLHLVRRQEYCWRALEGTGRRRQEDTLLETRQEVNNISSKSPGGHGKRFVGSGRFPGFFSPFAHLSGDGIRTTDSRSHLGV